LRLALVHPFFSKSVEKKNLASGIAGFTKNFTFALQIWQNVAHMVTKYQDW
jgi:hypothetical protein